MWVCASDSFECCNNQSEEGMICISCECVGVTRSNAAKIREREVCLVSRVSVWKLLDRMLQQIRDREVCLVSRVSVWK